MYCQSLIDNVGTPLGPINWEGKGFDDCCTFLVSLVLGTLVCGQRMAVEEACLGFGASEGRKRMDFPP